MSNGPIGKDTPLTQLAVHAARASMERSGLQDADIDHLLDGIHDRGAQPLAAPLGVHRHCFHIAAPQCDAAVQQSALHHRGVGDHRAAVQDQRVHAAQRVFPVVLAEVPVERRGEHQLGVLAGFVVQIRGVNQAGGVDLGLHTLSSTPAADSSAAAPSGPGGSGPPCRCRRR